MRQISMQIPDDALAALMLPQEGQDRIGGELLLLAAAKLYELGRLSSGAAARLAGIPRTVLLARLAEYGVDTFNVTEEELHGEASNRCPC